MPIDTRLVAIVGGVQPERFPALDNVTSDGLWPYFLPIILAKPALGEDVQAGGAEEDDDRSLDDLLRVPPLMAKLSAEAQEERRAIETYCFGVNRRWRWGACSRHFLGSDTAFGDVLRLCCMPPPRSFSTSTKPSASPYRGCLRWPRVVKPVWRSSSTRAGARGRPCVPSDSTPAQKSPRCRAEPWGIAMRHTHTHTLNIPDA